ncbi:MAG: CsgE family curli-type amyloid fiber assembly protein [Colwellia sp.]
MNQLYKITLFLLMSSPVVCFGEPIDSEVKYNDKEAGLELPTLGEIPGLVVNRTVTLLGANFYRNFTAYWRMNYADNMAIITIYERPTARFGSQIWVDYKGKKLVQQFIGPTKLNDKKLAGRSAQIVSETIVKLKLTEILRDTFDIEKDEI